MDESSIAGLPYEDWVRQWQSGVWLTHDYEVPAEQRYSIAESLIAEAREHLNDVDNNRAAIDQADTIRDSDRVFDAVDLLDGAISFFSPDEYPKDRATAFHHKARRLRAVGSNLLAYEAISPALTVIRHHNRTQAKSGEEFDPEQIWIELDASAIAGINQYVTTSRKLALQALKSIVKFRSQEAKASGRNRMVDLARLRKPETEARVIAYPHLGRAALLFKYATNPTATPQSRKAFGIPEPKQDEKVKPVILNLQTSPEANTD